MDALLGALLLAIPTLYVDRLIYREGLCSCQLFGAAA
jgi:hypothetical protein